MHIKWQERVPDVEVLKRAGTVSAESCIIVTQLRWAGHVSRMPENQLLCHATITNCTLNS